MMRTLLRVTALFAAYATIGFGGDWAAGLLASEGPNAPVDVRVEAVSDAEPVVTVDVRPELVTRVRVRHGDRCTFEDQLEYSVPASDVAAVAIDAGAGALHVEGRDGLDEIVIVGLACASHEELLAALDIRAELRDDVLTLETLHPEQRARRGDTTARIDLTVLVPTGFDVSIDDSSGHLVASGLGDVRIDDSSGNVEVFDVGSLRLDDSSGGVDVQDVHGDLWLDDSSGGIDIRRVDGSVTLRDGSGGIDIVDVGADVLIEADGSGGIDVRDVGGDFTVARDGSGGIRHSGVEGRVDVPRKR